MLLFAGYESLMDGIFLKREKTSQQERLWLSQTLVDCQVIHAAMEAGQLICRHD